MKNLVQTSRVLLLASFALFAFSCNNDDDILPTEENYGDNLQNIANTVIVKNYDNLKQKGEALATAANSISIGNESSLTAAKNAWKEMRIYWENSETTLYGPAGDEMLGVDGNIDSWPIDLQFVTDVLNGSTPITVDFIAIQDANAKGFHALEYLLWGIDGKKTASQLTAREIEYIKATAGYLKQQTSNLYQAWSPAGNNFAANLINADSGIYQSQISALIQLVDGMAEIANEVGSGKIYDPMYGNNGSFSLEDEESRFSNNSKTDFADNIRGIQYIYSGDYKNISTGLGISEIVAVKNPELDKEVTKAIQDAISAIENIPGTFTNAVQNNRPQVENAIVKVNDLEKILNAKLKPYISQL